MTRKFTAQGLVVLSCLVAVGSCGPESHSPVAKDDGHRPVTTVSIPLLIAYSVRAESLDMLLFWKHSGDKNPPTAGPTFRLIRQISISPDRKQIAFLAANRSPDGYDPADSPGSSALPHQTMQLWLIRDLAMPTPIRLGSIEDVRWVRWESTSKSLFACRSPVGALQDAPPDELYAITTSGSQKLIATNGLISGAARLSGGIVEYVGYAPPHGFGLWNATEPPVLLASERGVLASSVGPEGGAAVVTENAIVYLSKDRKVRVDAGGPTEGGSGWEALPVWMPAGRRVVVSKHRRTDSESQIIEVDFDMRTSHVICKIEGEVVPIAFTRDGTAIIVKRLTNPRRVSLGTINVADGAFTEHFLPEGSVVDIDAAEIIP